MRFANRALSGTAFAIALAAPSAHAQTAASPEFFETKIRPVLANNCFGCHTNSAMGGLRLDSLEALKKGGEHGTALVPGDPEKSALISRVKETNNDLRMPKGGKLKPAEIADLDAWVKAGAPWPKSVQTAAAPKDVYAIAPERRNFWSFKPLQDPPVPAVKDVKWPKSDLDRFVLAALEKEGLKPVRPANKRDLIRRATLDLTGLPPTPDEIAAFEKDTSPNAFAKVVDRLLASPHYGERWGRTWLDLARYGEDDYRSLNPFPRGYRPYQNAFAYRDWVIQAFNDDMPYDQFVKAQLAGDLMDPKVRHKMLPATGFLGLGPWYYDNGSNEVTRADERHDRVDAVTRGFMGLTVACARCHDHKYDPIPQKDYYALAGVFFNTIYEEYPLAPKKVVDEFTKLEADLDKKQKILMEANQALSNELSRSLALQTSNYLEGVWEVTGRQKKEMAQVVEARKLDFEVLDRWIKYMAKPTDKYKNKEAWQAMIKKGGSPQEAKKLAAQFQDELIAVMLERNEIDAENKVIADKDLEGTKPKKRTDKPSNFVSNRDFNPGSWLRLKALPDDQNAFWTEVFQRELKDAEDPNAMMAAGGRMGTPGVLMFRGWSLESRIGPEAQARVKTMQADIDAARKKLDPYYPFVHGVRDSEHPVNIQLALRGNPETLGEEVPRHFLSVFGKDQPAPLNQGSGRMQLAEEILKQPISLRVIVNRIWKGHFGTGIVDTPSNFGFGGERPTNPELLEHLASTFAKDGMSIKSLHRKIMLSSAYQLSTENDKVAFEKDSGNRLYWRMNPRRMDAEQLRDSVLAVAGNLDDLQQGGPSQELTPAFKGRTVYGKVSRYKLDAYLQLFDFPSPNISAEKRFTTTVPLQRLFLMNSDFMQIEAEEFAKRIAAEPTNRDRIRKAYQLAYGRAPKEEEIQLGLEYLQTEPLRAYEEIKNKPADAEGAGRRRRGPGADNAIPPPPGENAAPPPSNPMEEVQSGAATQADAGGMGMGMGMMGGMGGFMGGPGGPGGRRGAPGRTTEIKYDATAWGRYAKVLLSSSEFMFIN